MKYRVLRLVQWLVLPVAAVVLYRHLAVGEGSAMAAQLHAATSSMPSWFWPAMLLLTLANWGMEAVKWRKLVAAVEPMRFRRAFAATLAGTSVGLVTPNRTGEFLGRVFFISPGNRLKGACATAMGSMAQLITTLLAGMAALATGLFLPAPGDGRAYLGGLGLAALVVAAALLGLYVRPSLLQRLVRSVPLLHRLSAAVQVMDGYSRAQRCSVLGLSMVRYAIFCLQYLLCLSVFTGLGWQAGLPVVPVIYLVSTLVPTMLLSELGVRGSVAVALLAPLGMAPVLVLLASFAVWAMNLALPAAAGAVVLAAARLRARP